MADTFFSKSFSGELEGVGKRGKWEKREMGKRGKGEKRKQGKGEKGKRGKWEEGKMGKREYVTDAPVSNFHVLVFKG
jgi:hypothetical protein